MKIDGILNVFFLFFFVYSSHRFLPTVVLFTRNQLKKADNFNANVRVVRVCLCVSHISLIKQNIMLNLAHKILDFPFHFAT